MSKTTVSRYLNGKYEYMSSDTRKRIQKVIEDLQYRPNRIARTLKSNRSGLIGALIADITSPFSSILLKGISDICEDYGYHVIISNTDNDPRKEREYIKSLIENRVEGIIVNTTGYNDDFLVDINNSEIPVVLADRGMNELKIDTVVTDNSRVTRDTVNFLIGQGYRNIAFFTEPIHKSNTRYVRMKSFLNSMKQFLGVDAEDLIYIIDIQNDNICSNKVNNFYKRFKDEPKAILAVNGVTLLNVLKGIRECNYKIPEDIGICGFDEWGWSSLVSPGITVIAQQTYKIGALSAELLLKKIDGKLENEVQYIQLPAELIVRGSTSNRK